VILVGFSLAVLAGFGAARIRNSAVVALLAVAVLGESVSLPMPLTAIPTEAPPVICRHAARQCRFAACDDRRTAESTTRVVRTTRIRSTCITRTFHWQTLVNGYSGFFPPALSRSAAAVMRTFPDARSLEMLRAREDPVCGASMASGWARTSTAALLSAADACACGLTLVTKRLWQTGEISIYRVAL
jgi:hypothetical protein